MKTYAVVCNECKKPVVHPGLIDVKMKFRANTGIAGGHENPQHPGITKGIMGFVEVDIEGDFCDMTCLRNFALTKAAEKDSGVLNVAQDIFYRGDDRTPGGPK